MTADNTVEAGPGSVAAFVIGVDVGSSGTPEASPEDIQLAIETDATAVLAGINTGLLEGLAENSAASSTTSTPTEK